MELIMENQEYENYKKAQKMLTEDDAVIIPLFVDALNVLVSPKVKGLSLNAMDSLRLKDVVIVQ